MHEEQSCEVRLRAQQEWADAVSTARIAAAVGHFWPAAQPRGRRCTQRTDSSAAIEQRRRTRQELHRARSALAEQRQSDAQGTHRWLQVGRRQYCTVCGVFRANSGPGAAPCPGHSTYAAQLVADPRGHSILVADIFRPGQARPSALFACQVCGAWSDTGVSRALLRCCTQHPPSKHARSAVQRIKRGNYPKPGRRFAGFVVESLRPLHEVLASVEE